MLTSLCNSRKRGTSGATWRRPKPAGAVMRKWPLALTPPAETLASALAKSASRRWQSSRKALPSCVSVMRRVVRNSSLTPRRCSSASRRRPMIAGATSSARAAAVKLPRVATATKVSICLSLAMAVDYRHKSQNSTDSIIYCTDFVWYLRDDRQQQTHSWRSPEPAVRGQAKNKKLSSSRFQVHVNVHG